MKVLYAAREGSNKVIPVTTGGGYQYVLLWLERDNDWYVYYCDTSVSQVYLNKIKNKFATSGADMFSGFNFDRIDNDEEFNSIIEWIENNYNYNGIHQDDKRDGVDGVDYYTDIEKQFLSPNV